MCRRGGWSRRSRGFCTWTAFVETFANSVHFDIHLSLSLPCATKTQQSLSYPDIWWIMQQFLGLHPSFNIYLCTVGECCEGKRWASLYTCLEGTVHQRAGPERAPCVGSLPKIGLHQLTKCAVYCNTQQQLEAEKERAYCSDTRSLTHYMYSMTK